MGAGELRWGGTMWGTGELSWRGTWATRTEELCRGWTAETWELHRGRMSITGTRELRWTGIVEDGDNRASSREGGRAR
jgi:hypothetical protein